MCLKCGNWKKLCPLDIIRITPEDYEKLAQENADLRQRVKELEAWREWALDELAQCAGFDNAEEMFENNINAVPTPAEALAAKEGK